MERLDDLPLGEQIEALLSVTFEPVTRADIAGWLRVTRDDPRAEEIDRILQRYRVPEESAAETHYWIDPSKQRVVLERLGVDVDSVHRRIVEVALGKLGRRGK